MGNCLQGGDIGPNDPDGNTETATKLRLNTSNENKYVEFKRMFASLGSLELDRTAIDLPEIDATPVEVVAHKATSCGAGILIEDTSLDVEGEDVGVNVRAAGAGGPPGPLHPPCRLLAAPQPDNSHPPPIAFACDLVEVAYRRTPWLSGRCHPR
jgi:hypothetical protein